ncbi:MAG: Asp-tRNA(Asn)/Glu-tRNA(Gln) amidotransferase subunit GatC [Sulfurihydrogenibium sp.]|jgi:aspartyl-tRNA(Asn)/glutamyl-tRNA(Gln) amidotransferase subunit C|uniref:Aspartyl/glutamyl-tRNA(Asn/Gln) amidotransferase subunit C n=1 Tax=Sulfurihydrogenibium azorense TaxID=309806 RepID=A0A831YCJ8_9AQUI|nr:MAG: Asp-tRNA(Asn)/Glu-tRNA(Gln) amidotransferase GatCAB subunit C [Sulfurihydrogenibium sp.]PMP76832.1 MAG: Asp-tRNA(Asn)/Glu-tRNA(Gln) amidotransferase GatCAB subunit C [Sulfurihydrogenibium sp.]HEV08977.1 Asp-tRNA(Asn)/Glu-tRNA(Gln) amidotransferase subunit GatC [Sulfurihydrogenibium azorense]
MVDKETVLKVAQLSKLKLKNEEVEIFSKQFNDILSFVEVLKEVDTEGVLPFYELDLQESYYRDDVAAGSISNEEALLNAPLKEGGFFVVPRVVG